MSRILAVAVSYIFQPLIMPTLIIWVMLLKVPQLVRQDWSHNWFLLLMVFLTTFVVPLLSIFVMKLTKTISSFELVTSEERVFPFSLVSLYYMVATYFFYLKLDVKPILILALATITICVVLLTSITFFWKISAHMIGVSGLVGIFTALSLKFPGQSMLHFVLLGIIGAGAIGTSRLYLNIHRPIDILSGFILGFGICFGAFYYLI